MSNHHAERGDLPIDVSGGLKPKKSGGGNWRRKLVPEFGGHLWR
jgi:hypothetical protein